TRGRNTAMRLSTSFHVPKRCSLRRPSTISHMHLARRAFPLSNSTVEFSWTGQPCRSMDKAGQTPSLAKKGNSLAYAGAGCALRQVWREPAFDFSDGSVFARTVVQHLITADLPHAEIFRLRVGKVESANRARWDHRVCLGQFDSGILLCVE